MEPQQVKQTLTTMGGFVLATLGFSFLLYGINFAGQNVVPATDMAWQQLYGAIVYILYGFIAIFAIGTLFMAIQLLMQVATAYQNRR